MNIVTGMSARMMDLIAPTGRYCLLCSLIFCAVYSIWIRRRSARRHSAGQILGLFVFLLYLWQVWYLTGVGTLWEILIKPEGAENVSLLQGSISLVPFQNIGKTFLLNIIMCIPLGILLPFLWDGFQHAGRAMLTGLFLSALIEISQLFNTRATDIDDLIANTLGTLIGYVAWRSFNYLTGDRLRVSRGGAGEAFVYILLSFGGVFCFYAPLLILRL